ncbi:MAG: PPOX class F420-dependent oxidoreductase [Chloroflexi bacterium]|nr:PPOX class F420-dependent oxidoreductase [Chloroflexota bacterium]
MADQRAEQVASSSSSMPATASAGARLSDEELREFLAGPWVCKLGTLTMSGAPYVTPLWYEYDGEGYVIIGRERAVWVEHIRHDGRVALCIDDPDGSHRRVLVEGLAEIVEGPSVRGPWLPTARRMAERYMGGPDGLKYMERTLDFPRVTVRVTPERTTTWRGGWARKYFE